MISASGTEIRLSSTGSGLPGKATQEQHPSKLPSRDEAPLCDCHFHLAGFRQQFGEPGDLVSAMDRAGVDLAVVFGMQIKQSWGRDEHVSPAHYLDNDAACYWDLATDSKLLFRLGRLPDLERERRLPFVCGFNPTDRDCADQLAELLQQHPGRIAGVGELLLRHGALTHKLDGEKPRVDHEALEPLFGLAGEADLPVLIHNDIGAPGCPQAKYLPELRSVCRRHPATRFIWAHCGTNRGLEISGLQWILGDMLVEYPNLYLDLSWEVLWEQLVVDASGWELTESWSSLIEEFPTRFLFGSDAVGKRGIQQYDQLARRMAGLLQGLSPSTARAVARENLISILPAHIRRQVPRHTDSPY